MDSHPAEAIRAVFARLDDATDIPDINDLSVILESAQKTLDEENPVVRPRDAQGRPGGLILLDPNLTTIIVPDLHARTGYMRSLLDMEIDGTSVIDGLLSGGLQVLCVGDGFHSESRGAKRWKASWEEYRDGYRKHAAMDQEMRESLSLMAMVMILKAAVPDRFHFLKGNHENVTNADTEGNRPFGKYAWEGQMVRDWFLMFLGEDMLNRWAEFESSLPLLAVGDSFLVSHAEPRRAYGRDRVIEYRGDDELIFDFTWTGNGEAENGSVAAMLEEYLGPDADGALYFGGHRPVGELYRLRAGGRYVQIHNPDLYIAAILSAGMNPDPERDVVVIPEHSTEDMS